MRPSPDSLYAIESVDMRARALREVKSRRRPSMTRSSGGVSRRPSALSTTRRAASARRLPSASEPFSLAKPSAVANSLGWPFATAASTAADTRSGLRPNSTEDFAAEADQGHANASPHKKRALSQMFMAAFYHIPY